MSDAIQYRQIAPGPSPTSEGSDSPPREDKSPWKKRVSTACLACKKSKRKCSGIPPCDNCRAFNRVCIFDETLDQRRRVAAKRTADELNYHRDLLNDLYRLVRSANQTQALRLLDVIRGSASSEDIRSFIDQTLLGIAGPAGGASLVGGIGAGAVDIGGQGHASSSQRDSRNYETVSQLEGIRQLVSVEGASPPYRRKVMDIHYLCDEAPYKVPAKPWTTVTEDNDLVSHLLSLYIVWDYPVHGFLDADVLLRYMRRGDENSELCTRFLVNAILANACYFSDFSEAYVVPGDIMTKGADFLAEAERLRESESGNVCLASLQGTLLLYERYSISGDDDLGYIMLHEAIRMGKELGLVDDTGRGGRASVNGGSRLGERSRDMDISTRRTAWGLFHVDTMVHTCFLRPTLINQVNIPRIPRNLSPEKDLWMPYPTHRAARPSFQSQYFDESCNLCEIAREISRAVADDTGGQTHACQCQRQRREELYERLRAWHGQLPDIFDPGRRPPPHVVLLRMRYHTLVINTFSCIPGGSQTSTASTASNEISDALKTPESQPRASPLDSYSVPKYNISAITLSAARAISALARLHRREYGLNRAHQFAMYAINLALFTMLEQESFDILDQDFLSLSSAFSVIAARSVLGRNLFHIFRQSVRAKGQGRRIREGGSSLGVSDELKELFDDSGSGKFDSYAAGLEKLNSDERYHGIGPDDDGLQDYPGLGLFDMLDRYESLSLGKDEVAPGREKPEFC